MRSITVVRHKSELGEELNYNIEGLKCIGNVLVLHGWVVDPLRKLGSISVNPPGSRKAIDLQGKMVRFPRADVNAAFKAPNATVLTHYGFVAVLPDFEGVHALKSLGVAVVAKNRNVHVESVNVHTLPLDMQSLPTLMGIFTDMHLDAERCEKFYQPIFNVLRKESGSAVKHIDETLGKAASPAKPVVSVIIPLYGNTRFETTQIPALAALGVRDWEIILAVDDPRITETVRENAARLAGLYGISVRVIAVAQNLGFSGINNFAAERAKGKYLLFLNSDCFISGRGPIDKALGWLRTEKSAGAVGFRLAYADRSIQHDGMSVSRWNNDEHFLLNDHPRIGLPVNLVPRMPEGDESCMVTAACMMMSSEMFRSVGGFDRAYLRGDFEDSDLCLKLISRGLKIAIVRDDGLFHLERQTIAEQEGGLRQRITLVNSYIYTKKWRNVLKNGMKPLEVIE